MRKLREYGNWSAVVGSSWIDGTADVWRNPDATINELLAEFRLGYPNTVPEYFVWCCGRKEIKRLTPNAING